MRDIDAPSAPVRDAPGEDLHRLVVRVVEHLHLESVTRPIDVARSVKDTLGDVSLVVDGQLHTYARFAGCEETSRRRRFEPRCPQSEIEQVQPESKQQDAGHRQHGDREDRDHGASNSVYGRMVERTKATRASASGLWRRVHCMYRHADAPRWRAGRSRRAG